jgi:hypothetical protein
MTLADRLSLAVILAMSAGALAFAGPLTDDPVRTFTGTEADSYLGLSVSSAGDVSGDGYPDIVVGEPLCKVGPDYLGRTLVFLGSPVGLSTVPMPAILGTGGGFGTSVAAAGDLIPGQDRGVTASMSSSPVLMR